MLNKLNASDVLFWLDDQYEEHTFPVLGLDDFLRVTFVGVRLHCFRSADSWLCVFERVGYHSNNPGFVIFIDAFSPDGHQDASAADSLCHASGSLIDDEKCLIDPFRFEQIICGKLQTFQFSPKDHNDIGIDIKALQSAPEHRHDVAIAILRLLNDRYSDQFSSSPQQTLQLLGLEGEDYTCLLSLKHFYLPPKAQIPSESATIQSIANVLANADASLYQTSEPPNTRTEDWPYPGYS